MRTWLISCFVLFTALAHAQRFTIKGRITNTRLEPLAFASVEIKEWRQGTITKEDGRYSLLLDKGEYNLVVTMLGYKSQSIRLVIDRDYLQNIIMEPDDARSLGAVVIKGKSKDYAEDIIREVIRRKDSIQALPGAWSAQVYIKAVQQDSILKGKRKTVVVPDSMKHKLRDADLARMAMAEISIRLDYESAGRLKEERTGIKRAGNPESLFFLSVTEGNFNFMDNLVKIPALSPTPFLSPLSYSGLVAYRYKTVSIRQQGANKLYTISVKPKSISNATVEGELSISDSGWFVVHTRFSLPSYHLPEYDHFTVEQEYGPVENKAWMLSRQQFTYFSKNGKKSKSGQTTVMYQQYEIGKTFERKYFGEEVSAATTEAYERDSSFWQTVRTEPLTEKELRFIRYRDSIYRVTHTQHYLDSVDRLTNTITWKKLAFTGQTFFKRKKERSWSLPPVTTLIQPFGFGGARLSPSFYYHKVYPSKKTLSLSGNLSYGFRNKDINGRIGIFRMYNAFNRGYYRISAGRDFNYIFSGDAWINMLKRSNMYLNHEVGVGHNIELVNGLFLYMDADMSFRRSLATYRTGTVLDSIAGDALGNNRALAFQSYNALYGKVRIQYTPKQRYIREPRQKVILGSNWPTFYVSWRKGVPGLFNSTINFDYLEGGLEQEMGLGLVGQARYSFRTGKFVNKKDLRLIDFKYQRRGDPLLFMNPDEAFQALDSTFAVFRQFYQAHFVHEFNGALVNKIPLLKKLRLREVTGGGFLLAPERNLRYAEMFAGIERVFKSPFDPAGKYKLGIYIVGSAANQYNKPLLFKVGITSWNQRNNKWY